MDRSGPVAARQQLLLWAGIVMVALGLLAMHQLSLNHTIVNPGASHASAALAPAHLDQHASDDGHAAGHAHLVATLDQSPRSGDAGCLGCGEHHAVTLTCLAMLTFVAVGWALSGPIEWRHVRLRPLFARKLPEPPRWTPLPLSLTELSISRT